MSSVSGRVRRAGVVLCAVWGIHYLRAAEPFGLLDAVDLPIHETGHLLFAPFGELVGFLGGTLLQLAFPAAFVVYFMRRGDRYAAYLVLGWIAQNLWNIARYIGDARAQELPLVGGGEHDWAYLLGRAGLMTLDRTLAAGVHFAGIALFAYALAQAFFHSAAVPDAGPTGEEPWADAAGTPGTQGSPAPRGAGAVDTGPPDR